MQNLVLKNYDVIRSLWDISKRQKELNELLLHYKMLHDLVKAMIDILLIRIHVDVNSNEDKQRLTKRIIILLVKNLKNTLQSTPPLTELEYYRVFLGTRITDSLKVYARNKGIDIDNLPYYLEKLDGFERQFLTN
jgi:hypothetical protein